MDGVTDPIRLDAFRRRGRGVYFNRRELNLLLDVYSRRVAQGEWRDYAINQGHDRAVFSIFRHSADRPLFAVAKFAPGAHRQGDFAVSMGPRLVKQGKTLTDVLAVFKRKTIRIVAGNENRPSA